MPVVWPIRREVDSTVICRCNEVAARANGYGALTSIPAGLTPAEHASLRWTHYGANIRTNCMILLSNNITANLFVQRQTLYNLWVSNS